MDCSGIRGSIHEYRYPVTGFLCQRLSCPPSLVLYQFSFAHSTKGPTYTHIPLAHPWLAPRVGGHAPTEDPTASPSTFRRGRGAPKVLGDGHRPFPRVCPGQPEALGPVTRSLPPLTPHTSLAITVAHIWHAGECSWTRHLCVLSVVASVPMCTADGRLRFIAFGVCECRIGSLLNACECESIVLRIYRF